MAGLLPGPGQLPRPGGSGGGGLLLGGTITQCDSFLLHVFFDRGIDQRQRDAGVGLDPARYRFPVLAIPLHEAGVAAAFVVLAAGAHLREHVAHAQFLLAFGVDVDVLHAPADLVAVQRFGAVFLLRGADGFHHQDAADHAAVVVDGADEAFVRQVALAGAVHHFFDVLDHRKLLAVQRKAAGNVALGGVAGGDGVFFRATPPVGHDLLTRVAHFLRRLQRRRRHHAPAAQYHEVRALAANVQPLRLLLGARRRHLDVFQLETVLLGHGVQYRDGFLAVGRAVVQVDDLLAAQFVHAAQALADELDLGGGLAPVAGDQREGVLEGAAILRVGAAEAHGHQRDLVLVGAIHHRVGNAGGHKVEGAGTAVLGFQPLVALHSAVVLVFGLALFVG